MRPCSMLIIKNMRVPTVLPLQAASHWQYRLAMAACTCVSSYAGHVTAMAFRQHLVTIALQLHCNVTNEHRFYHTAVFPMRKRTLARASSTA